MKGDKMKNLENLDMQNLDMPTPVDNPTSPHRNWRERKKLKEAIAVARLMGEPITPRLETLLCEVLTEGRVKRRVINEIHKSVRGWVTEMDKVKGLVTAIDGF